MTDSTLESSFRLLLPSPPLPSSHFPFLFNTRSHCIALSSLKLYKIRLALNCWYFWLSSAGITGTCHRSVSFLSLWVNNSVIWRNIFNIRILVDCTGNSETVSHPSSNLFLAYRNYWDMSSAVVFSASAGHSMVSVCSAQCYSRGDTAHTVLTTGNAECPAMPAG